jgi:hypothetical protein
MPPGVAGPDAISRSDCSSRMRRTWTPARCSSSSASRSDGGRTNGGVVDLKDLLTCPKRGDYAYIVPPTLLLSSHRSLSSRRSLPDEEVS